MTIRGITKIAHIVEFANLLQKVRIKKKDHENTTISLNSREETEFIPHTQGIYPPIYLDKNLWHAFSDILFAIGDDRK